MLLPLAQVAAEVLYSTVKLAVGVVAQEEMES
jgi:hypothetical protein